MKFPDYVPNNMLVSNSNKKKCLDQNLTQVCACVCVCVVFLYNLIR